MRKRTVRIQFWLNGKEAETFNKKLKCSGLCRESYLRHLIADLVPTDKPPPDYYNMMRELHTIGNNLNQIAYKAHSLHVVDVERYDAAVALLSKAVVDISHAVMLPRKLQQHSCQAEKQYEKTQRYNIQTGGKDART